PADRHPDRRGRLGELDPGRRGDRRGRRAGLAGGAARGSGRAGRGAGGGGRGIVAGLVRVTVTAAGRPGEERRRQEYGDGGSAEGAPTCPSHVVLLVRAWSGGPGAQGARSHRRSP